MVGKYNKDFTNLQLSMLLGMGKALPSPPGLEYIETRMATRPLVPPSIHGLLLWSTESQFSAGPIAIHQSLYFLFSLRCKYNHMTELWELMRPMQKCWGWHPKLSLKRRTFPCPFLPLGPGTWWTDDWSLMGCRSSSLCGTSPLPNCQLTELLCIREK